MVRYLAIFGPVPGTDENASGARSAELRDIGLRHVSIAPGIALHVGEVTRTLGIPAGGILLGHVFSHDGSPLRQASQLPAFTEAGQVREYLLDQCWGPYLLLQPDPRGGLTVLREPSPSGDVACFYRLQAGQGFITSDISLAECAGVYRRSIDWDAIVHRLAFPQIKTARTALAGLQELLPGCALHVRDRRHTVQQVWSPWRFVARDARHHTPEQAAADIRRAVVTATQALARVDRSVLLELSGGLDSSIVSASLRGAVADVTCTSLVTTVPGADERQYAAQIADLLGVPLHTETLQLEAARFAFAPHPQCVMPRVGVLQHAVDEVMLAAAARHGANGFFSGGGGDTIFCALDTAAPAADAVRERGVIRGLSAVQDLAALHQCTFWKAGRLTLRKLRRPPAMVRPADRSFLAADMPAMQPNAHPWSDAPPDALPGDVERIRGLATCQAYRDSLARGALRPVRMPLLSQPVVEACLRVPTWMWIAGGVNRAVARAAFADVLPAEILHRRSKGTFMSYLGAVYQRNRPAMRDFLLQGRLQQRGLLDVQALHAFMGDGIPEGGHAFTRVFDLCMVENWVSHQP